jgi:2-haloalkanoic acid dehalogenase type II
VRIESSVEEIEEALTRTEKEFKESNYQCLCGKISSDEYWQEWNSSVLRHLNLLKNEELPRHIQAKWFDYVKLKAYSDATATLSKLKQMGVKTGLITTAFEKEITFILGKANLDKRLFDVIVGADTVGKMKPHPDVFKYALKKLNVKPAEALFIGDEMEADCRGAEKVGIEAILIQRKHGKTMKNFTLRKINKLKEVFVYIE